MPRTAKYRVIGNLVFDTEFAEPAIGKVYLESQRKSVARSGSQTHSQQAASGSSAPGQSRAVPCASNKAPIPCAPNLDRANRRSAAPDDRVEPPCRDQTNRKIVLARLPADPSCAAPADALSTNGITDRESSQREFCNTIPQSADIVGPPRHVRVVPTTGISQFSRQLNPMAYGRASRTMLKGVSVARRTLENPPLWMTPRSFVSPA